MRYDIPTKLQEFNKDIEYKDLRYHACRVLVAKEFTFDAAHHLHCYDGKCKSLHGHTYKVVVGISGYLNDIGMVVDFRDIKMIWKHCIEPYLDHRYLNETLPLMNTTAENMVKWIFDEFEKNLKDAHSEFNESLRVEFVRLYETPTSYAEIRREWVYE